MESSMSWMIVPFQDKKSILILKPSRDYVKLECSDLFESGCCISYTIYSIYLFNCIHSDTHYSHYHCRMIIHYTNMKWDPPSYMFVSWPLYAVPVMHNISLWLQILSIWQTPLCHGYTILGVLNCYFLCILNMYRFHHSIIYIEVTRTHTLMSSNYIS